MTTNDRAALSAPLQAAPDFARLGRETHVWRAALDRAEPDAVALAACLAQDERERASRFPLEVDRRDFMVARGILRVLIGRYLGCAPEDVAFVYGPHGKPALPPDTSLQFNLAHSHRLALFAFTEDAPLGVDVEYVRPARHDALAARFFSPAECAELERIPPDSRQEAFFRCWTRKEAYIKGLGGGLSVPLDRFDVPMTGDPGPWSIVDRGQPGSSDEWELHDLDAGRGFRAALAVKKHTRIHVYDLPVPIRRA